MEANQITSILLYLLVGLITGIVNTLAGGGSVFVFSTLLFLGMPASLANGTNRLGIFVQNTTGTITFFKNKLLNIKEASGYVLPSVIGSIAGALVATDLPAKMLEPIVGCVMIALMVPSFKRPKVAGMRQIITLPRYVQFLIFLAIGFYGGFVQAGIGLIILAILPQFSNLSLIRANAVKMAIILILSIPALLIFAWNDQINWPIACWLALGQFLGTWIAGKWATDNPKANTFTRWLLMIMVTASALKMFGVFQWAIAFFINH